MDKLVTITENGYKPLCRNCSKYYMCNGPHDCVQVLLERLYRYENGLNDCEVQLFDKVRVCHWDELRDRCTVDGDDTLFFTGPIETFTEYDSKFCGTVGKVVSFDEYKNGVFYLDTTGDLKLTDDLVVRL